MSKQEPITGFVAEILNKRELVINRGSKDGVEVGMVFQVLEDARNIMDPETRETLGRVQRPKIRVRVAELQERLSVASTYETYRVNLQSPMPGLAAASFLYPARTVTRVKELYYDDPSEKYDPFDKTGAVVAKVDAVQQVVEEPAEEERG